MTGTRIGVGAAPSEIKKAIDTKANEVVRIHNHRFARKGAELLRVLNLVGLETANADELIGRLLETIVVADSDPGKVAVWIAAGEKLRREHNPQARDGVFNAVVQNVEPGGETAQALTELGLKYKASFDGFEGTVDIAAVVSTLAGTKASLRMRVGKEGRKGGTNYVVVLRDGEEVSGARTILLGSDKTGSADGAGAGAGTDADASVADDKASDPRANAGRAFGQRPFSGRSTVPPAGDKLPE